MTMQKASESCWNFNIPKVGYYPNFSPSFDIFSGDALCYAYFRFSLSAVLFFILFVFAIREATFTKTAIKCTIQFDCRSH